MAFRFCRGGYGWMVSQTVSCTRQASGRLASGPIFRTRCVCDPFGPWSKSTSYLADSLYSMGIYSV